MLKKILLGIGVLIVIGLAIGATGIYYFLPSENKILDFIKNNPDKTAILLVRNDSVIANQNPNKIMPLASTVKIILAIEYAEQSSKNQINPDELISLSELEKFHIPNTDGNAHSSWLNSIKEKKENGQISIREVAKGMISYSSNANTEWLLNKLGKENVNKRLDSLGIKNHTEIYNIVSSLFVGKERFPNLKGEELEEGLKNIDLKEYIETTNVIHEKLLSDTLYKKDVGDLGMNIQKVWSDKLPASTVSEYVGIMKKINSRSYFKPKVQEYLDEVMEYLLENPTNKEWLEHAGMKGGSTAFVLTKSLYASDKKRNKTELAYFIDNLSILEMTKLQMSMNDFELKILTNKEFRNKIKNELELK